jgi:hypothetical protein
MQFRRKWNGRREFTPKSSTDNFSFFNKTDIAEIEVVKLYLSVAIKAGFITPCVVMLLRPSATFWDRSSE